MECICISAASECDDGVDLFGECAAPIGTDGSKFLSVGGGDGFSIGINDRGAVIGWGSSFYGELGERRDAADDQQPIAAAHVRIRASPARIAVPEQCVQVSCGASHVLVVAQSGGVYAWGWNHHRQVSPSAVEVLPHPSLVDFATSAATPPEAPCVRVRAVAAGGMHSLALDSAGRMWSWGDNTHGQLGIGSEGTAGESPAVLALPRKATSIAAGWAHSALLTDSQELFTFGFGLYHQLGHGTTQNQSKPLAVDALSGLDASCGGPVVQVACGSWHTAVRTASGDVYTWGWGRDGQLGPGRPMETLPRVVDFTAECSDPDDPGHQAVDIACGSRRTLVLCASGELRWWGQQHTTSRSGRGRPARHEICRRVAMGHSHALLLVERRPEEQS